MDPIPSETHAAELAATIDDLERGLAQVPLSKAVNRIDDWRREVLSTERDDLQPIADDLERLHDLLVGGDLDGAAIGDLLARLGEQTEASAEGAAEPIQNGLRRLGSLLRHAGNALAGNARQATDEDAGTSDSTG